MVWPTLRPRTAKEQNKTMQLANCGARSARGWVGGRGLLLLYALEFEFMKNLTVSVSDLYLHWNKIGNQCFRLLYEVRNVSVM